MLFWQHVAFIQPSSVVGQSRAQLSWDPFKFKFVEIPSIKREPKLLQTIHSWFSLNDKPVTLCILSISTNSGWIVVEWMPSLWKNSFTFSAIFIYSDKLRHLKHNIYYLYLLYISNFNLFNSLYLICADAIILSPANCQTWNSWTAKTPSTFSKRRCWITST